MLSPSNTIAAHHKGTARVAAISGRCCFAAPKNLIATVNNNTAMIDEVLTQSPMAVTIIITAIRQHPFWPLPQDRCGYIVTWLIISRRRMPNNGATCLSFQELKKFQDMQFLSHPCVGDTQGYGIHTQELWMLCRKPWLISTEEFGLKLQQMRNEKDAKQWRRRSFISWVEEIPQDMQFLSHPCVGHT